MGKRWSANQQFSHHMRRMEKRAFYRDWDRVHQPKSADGTRQCRNCEFNYNCQKSRQGNHLYCFSPNADVVEKQEEYPSKKPYLKGIILAVVGIAVFILLCANGGTVIALALLLFLIFLL